MSYCTYVITDCNLMKDTVLVRFSRVCSEIAGFNERIMCMYTKKYKLQFTSTIFALSVHSKQLCN